jgi:hypothetical protein
MAKNSVDCEIEFSPVESKFGRFANAFRVTPEAGDECFLDFCVYSAQEQSAQIVARVRVHRSFLPIIRERLGEDIERMQRKPMALEEGLIRTSAGRLVLFKTPDGEQ